VVPSRSCNSQQQNLRPHPARRSRRTRLRKAGSAAAVTISIVISAIALKVSILAYQDQHSSDTAAQATAVRTYANQVSYWTVTNIFTGAIRRLEIQNLGPEPITNVYVMVSYTESAVGVRLPKTVGNDLSAADLPAPMYLGTIPPCTVMTTTTAIQLLSEMFTVELALDDPKQARVIKKANPQAVASGIRFTDANGVTWARNASGVLSPASVSGFSKVAWVPPSLSPARGCT
jgi:hypothetical protein